MVYNAGLKVQHIISKDLLRLPQLLTTIIGSVQVVRCCLFRSQVKRRGALQLESKLILHHRQVRVSQMQEGVRDSY